MPAVSARLTPTLADARTRVRYAQLVQLLVPEFSMLAITPEAVAKRKLRVAELNKKRADRSVRYSPSSCYFLFCWLHALAEPIIAFDGRGCRAAARDALNPEPEPEPEPQRSEPGSSDASAPSQDFMPAPTFDGTLIRRAACRVWCGGAPVLGC